ncbi:MazG nucleotide pyrophosphohydrolase domain-containing protein [Pediococcus siamensis]|uniref:MazG nucleotide pyrophosphohydrolase domain-containing protein n=1 Tax=Pediococcus siamensis TaxID=381829 RepID=UPI0039A1E33D
MDLKAHQDWLIDFYKGRNWYQYSSAIRINYLTEEVGELSRAVRALEIGRDHPGEQQTMASKQRNLEEELADVLDQVLILCGKYDVDPKDLLRFSEEKLKQRFQTPH